MASKHSGRSRNCSPTIDTLNGTLRLLNSISVSANNWGFLSCSQRWGHTKCNTSASTLTHRLGIRSKLIGKYAISHFGSICSRKCFILMSGWMFRKVLIFWRNDDLLKWELNRMLSADKLFWQKKSKHTVKKLKIEVYSFRGITKSLFDLNRIDSLALWFPAQDRRADSHESRQSSYSWRDQVECQSIQPDSAQKMSVEWHTVCGAESSERNT